MTNYSDIAQEISMIMPRIARRILFEFFQTIDIPQSQLFAIITLADMSPCRLSDLANALHISAPTATGIVDRLEKGGYVKRTHDTQDRRAVNVELTNKGIKIAKKLRETIQLRWQELIENLSEKEADQYLFLLKKIYGAM